MLIEYLNWWSQSWLHVVIALPVHVMIVILIEESIANVCRVGIAFANRPKDGGSKDV